MEGKKRTKSEHKRIKQLYFSDVVRAAFTLSFTRSLCACFLIDFKR